MQHPAQADGDDGHDGQRAKGAAKHQALGLLQRQQQRDEEGLVADLGEEDEQQGLDEALPAGGEEKLGASASPCQKHARRGLGPGCNARTGIPRPAGGGGPAAAADGSAGGAAHRTGSSPTMPGMKAPALPISSLAAAGLAASRPVRAATAAAAAAAALGPGREGCKQGRHGERCCKHDGLPETAALLTGHKNEQARLEGWCGDPCWLRPDQTQTAHSPQGAATGCIAQAAAAAAGVAQQAAAAAPACCQRHTLPAAAGTAAQQRGGHRP